MTQEERRALRVEVAKLAGYKVDRDEYGWVLLSPTEEVVSDSDGEIYSYVSAQDCIERFSPDYPSDMNAAMQLVDIIYKENIGVPRALFDSAFAKLAAEGFEGKPSEALPLAITLAFREWAKRGERK